MDISVTPPIFNEIRRSFIINGKDNILTKRMTTSKLTELINAADMHKTNDGKDFILGYGGYDDKVVVLGTTEFLRKLCSTDTIYMSCFNIQLQTKVFKHLYTCHCFVGEKIVTTVYALLYKNNTKTYSRMLRLINTTANRNNFKFNPSKFYIDVDLNIIPAIEETFGRGISIKLSLFHYANSIWYKVKSLGLSQNNDVNIKKTIRRICCLAMVPIEQIEDTWIKIKEEAPQNENLLELVSYITETFMISNVGHKFDKTVWNHYDTNNIKTINHLEGWNDFIDEDINKSYLTIKNFVIKLKNKQQSFEMDFIKNHEKSNEISTFPKKFKSIEKKFKRAKERLENGTISAMEYLDEII